MATLVKKAAPAAKSAPKKVVAAEGLEGYNVKSKQKEVMSDCVINIKNGRFIASGLGSDGTKMTRIMNQQGSIDAIEAGYATAGEGFEQAEAPKKGKK